MTVLENRISSHFYDVTVVAHIMIIIDEYDDVPLKLGLLATIEILST